MTLEYQLERTLSRWIGLIVAAKMSEASVADLADGGEDAWAIYQQHGDRLISSEHPSHIGILAERKYSGYEAAGNHQLGVTVEVVTHIDDGALAGESRSTIHGQRVRALELALSESQRTQAIGEMNSVAERFTVETFGREVAGHLLDGRDETHHIAQLVLNFFVSVDDGWAV